MSTQDYILFGLFWFVGLAVSIGYKSFRKKYKS